MQGRIQKRVGKRGMVWTAVVDLPRDPVTGKRKQKRITARTKKEAEELVAKTLHEVQTGSYVEPSTLTVGQWLTAWLESHAVLDASTQRYDGIVRGRLIPAFGDLRLARLTAQRVQLAYKEWAAAGLSPTTVLLHHAVLREALAQAVKERLLVHNPADAVQRPRARHVEMQVWSKEEANAFLAGVSGEPDALVWQLALATGMRKGEILALRWPDVDLRDGWLSVQRTLTRGKRGFTIGDVKTRAGRRRVRLGRGLVAALRAHRQGQLAQRLAAGPAWHDADLVFTRHDGQHLVPEVVARQFKAAVRRLGLKEIRFHDLRHTYATVALADGARVKEVSAQLGHSSVAITMDRYAHVVEAIQVDLAERMEALLGVRAR
jgi:integrase